MDQLPRLGKRELICLLLFTCNYVVSVERGFLFLWVLGIGYVILLLHSLSLPYNYFGVWEVNQYAKAEFLPIGFATNRSIYSQVYELYDSSKETPTSRHHGDCLSQNYLKESSILYG